MKNFEEINRTFTVKTNQFVNRTLTVKKNSILQGLRLDQKVSKVLRETYETVTRRLRDDKARNMSGARVAQEWLKYAAMFVMLLTLGIGNVWGADTNVTINFGTASGNWAAQTNASFTDSDSRSWSRTYSAGNKTSGGTNYSQFGNSSNTCTSLVLTATAGKAMTLKTFTVTMEGASSNTAGTIYLYKRTSGGSETQLGTATVSGTTSVTCSMSSNTSFAATDILKVDYVGTAKSLRVTQLTYSYGTAAANVTLHWATNGSGGTSTSTQAQSATLPEKSDLNCSWNFIGWMPSEYTGKSSSGMISAGQTAGANTNLYALYSHPTHGSTNTLSTSPRIYTVTQSNSNATESTYNYDCVSNVETDIVNYYGAASGYALSATTPTVTVGGVAVDPSNIMWDITGDYGIDASHPGYLWISLDDYFGGNVVINVATELVCSNSVTINKGASSNCSFTLSKSGAQASCDGVSTTVTVTPDTGYGTPVVTESGASPAPTKTGSGNTQTLTYAENTTGTSTINVSCSANNYTITLNTDLTPTSAGTTSITATYNANTNLTSAITKPTKTGWTFGGYYTAKQGGGTQIIDASGNVLASKTGYTDASRNWIHADDVTLYAKWTCTVTWSVNGATNVYSTQTVTYNSSGSKVASIPGPPDPNSYCGQVFAGWTNAAIDGSQNSAPGTLFKTVGDSPNLNSTGNTTFYAVFADYAN